MDRIIPTLKNNPKFICKTVNTTTKSILTKKIVDITDSTIREICKYLSVQFFVRIDYMHSDSQEKTITKVLTRISDHATHYCDKNGKLLRNKIFFIPVKNHKTIIKVTTPDINPIKAQIITIAFIGTDALLVCKKFLNTQKMIDFKNTGLSVNTLYQKEATNGKITWRVSYKTIEAKNIDEIFTDVDTNSLIQYVKNWENSKGFYKMVNLIHKTGILLYGPPGTGKTTFAKAIAKEIKADMYIINMIDFNESQIERLKEDIEEYQDPSSTIVLLFEDIDCIFSTRDKLQTEKQKQAAQLLLQFLDGVYSLSNVLFIATTNHIEFLDKALIREGRFDVKIEMSNISESTSEKLCNHFKLSVEETSAILQDETFPINPAYLQNKIVKHIIEKSKENTNVSA